MCRFTAYQIWKMQVSAWIDRRRERSLLNRGSQLSAGEGVLSRRHEIVGRARWWISMNENTLQCVIKTNSNMNNSLIIGESFFLLYLARLYRVFFPPDDPPTLVLHDSLSLSFCLTYIRNIAPRGNFLSSLSLLHPQTYNLLPLSLFAPTLLAIILT